MICEEASKGEMKGVEKMAGGCGDGLPVATVWHAVVILERKLSLAGWRRACLARR